jgi:O-antigen ligase
MIIFLLAAACTLVAIYYLMRDVRKGILVTIAVKPIIDATWNYSFMDLSLLKIIGILFPILILGHALVRRESIFRFPLSFFWILYIYDNIWISTLVGLYENSPLEGMEYFFRILNGFAAFLMFQKLFTDREDFKHLIIAFLVAGVFPICIGVYQAYTGEIWQMRTSMGFIRKVGMYHDAFSFRHYAFQTLTAVLLYYSYFLNKSTKQSIMLLGLTIGAFVLLNNIFSKAAYAILGIWILGWTVMNKKPLMLVTILICIGSYIILKGGEPIKTAEHVFSKEIVYINIQDYESQMRVLAGRPTIWRDIISSWNRLGAFSKIFGSGLTASYHNDFLRALVTGGYVGLIVYLSLLAAISLRIVKNLLLKRTPLNVMALLLITTWIIDSIGLNQGLFPSYQWFIWGFISISIRGVSGLDANESESIAEVTLNPLDRHRLRGGRTHGIG